MAGMTVRFWGTRGSIPTPGRKTEKYGGNTCCVEARCGDALIVFDAGSGIRELGAAWTQEFHGVPIRANLFFTHLHWDHIQGFPFFIPAYQPGNALEIFGEERPGGSGIRELLSGQMEGSYFPVPISAMRSQLRFHSTTDAFEVDGLRVRTMKLPHPGGSLGYRIESDESVFVFATDCDLEEIAANRDELSTNPQAPRAFSDDVLGFFRGAALIVIDCQFLDEEYAERRGWGHNSIATVVDLCAQVRPHMLALFHHDPQHTDEIVTGMVQETHRRLEAKGVSDMLVFAAREGMTLAVQKPLRPAKLTP